MPAFWDNIAKNRLCDQQVRPGARIAWLGGINKFWGGAQNILRIRECGPKTKVFIANFHEIWGRPKKSSSSQKMYKFPRIPGWTTKKSAKKQFLLTNSEVITSILGVLGLELHSSGTEPVTFFGAQSSLGGHHILVWGGHKQWFGCHSPGIYPVASACCKFTAIYRTVTIAFLLKRCCSKSLLLKKWELFEVIKRCPKPFSTIFFVCENTIWFVWLHTIRNFVTLQMA